MNDTAWAVHREQLRRKFQPVDAAIDTFLGGPVTNSVDWDGSYPWQAVEMRLRSLLETCRHSNQIRSVCESIARHIDLDEARQFVLDRCRCATETRAGDV